MLTSNQPYRQYPYRYAICCLFALPSFINGMCWVVLTSISKKVATTYQVDEGLVTLVPMMYMIMYIFVNFPSNWILDVKGIRKGVIIGSVATALGAGIRSLCDLSFKFVLVGQFFCAIGQPFLLNAPAKIATFWFNEKHRPVATAGLAVVNIVGTGIGFVLPSLIVQEDETNVAQSKKQVLILMLVQFVLSFIAALLVIFLFRQKPPKPPSLGAETQKMAFKQSLQVMFKNRNFIYLLVGFSALNGAFNFLGSLLNLILKPFNYTDDQTSLLGGLMIGIGLVGSVVFSLYVEKTERYKRVFMFCCIMSICALLVFSFNLYYFQIFAVSLVVVTVMGLTLTPLMPLSFDFGCEIVFPIGQAQVTGILMTGGQIVGIIEILIVQQAYKITTPESAFISSIFVTIVLGLGMVGYFLVSEDLKRKDKQREKAREESVIESLA